MTESKQAPAVKTTVSNHTGEVPKVKKTYLRKKPDGTKIEFYIKSQHEITQLTTLADADSRDMNGMAHHLLRNALREATKAAEVAPQ